jgi:hypothetical protein
MRYSGSHWRDPKSPLCSILVKVDREVRTDSLLNVINSLKEVAMFKAAGISKFLK